jgi:hypothetical protein
MEPPIGRHFALQEMKMSARRLSRFAGLVFVLAAVFGGIGAASHAAAHEAGGDAASAIQMVMLESVWS